MLQRVKFIMCAAVILCLVVTTAKADTIISTGAFFNSVFHLDPYNAWYIAGEFTIDQDYTVTSVKSFLTYTKFSHDISVCIYADGGIVPGAMLYSQTFYATGTAGWQGASDLTWYLPAGTYWVGVGDSNFRGYVYSGRGPDDVGYDEYDILPNAIFYYSDRRWHNTTLVHASYWVEGTVVPLPSTVLLLGSGLLGLVGWRRFRKG